MPVNSVNLQLMQHYKRPKYAVPPLLRHGSVKQETILAEILFSCAANCKPETKHLLDDHVWLTFTEIIIIIVIAKHLQLVGLMQQINRSLSEISM